MFNYMWSQRAHYCQESCPMGDYSYPTGWHGEWIDENNVNTSNGTGDRTCHNCLTQCLWCRYQADHCLICRDTFFLMDLYTECMARYINPNNCSVCVTHNTCGTSATAADKKCVQNCPSYFYFELSWTDSSDMDLYVMNTRYDNYTRQSVAH